MGRFAHGGSEICYEDTGSGDPVLLIPGWAGSVESMRFLSAKLAANYRVIAADPPGSGQSGPQPRTYTKSYYHDDARSFLALLESLSAGPAHLVGFSDRGEYELVMAEMQPGAVRSIAAWGTAGQLQAPPEMIDAFATMIDSPFEAMEGLSEYLKATYGEANARIMAQSTANAYSEIIAAGGDISLSRAGEISCPVLLIAGEHDFVATPALVTQLVAAIPGVQYMEVKGASHEVQATHEEWLTQTIVDWLAKQ